MSVTYITFVRSHDMPIGFPVQMIVPARLSIKVTITAWTEEFWFFNVLKKVVVMALHLITGITLGTVTWMMNIVLRGISLLALQTEVILVEKARHGCNYVKVPIMHQ